MSTNIPNIADLQRAFYGGGTDAQYAALKAFAEAGINVTDLLALAQDPAPSTHFFATDFAPEAPVEGDMWVTSNNEVKRYQPVPHPEWTAYETISSGTEEDLPAEPDEFEMFVVWDGTQSGEASVRKYVNDAWVTLGVNDVWVVFSDAIELSQMFPYEMTASAVPSSGLVVVTTDSFDPPIDEFSGPTFAGRSFVRYTITPAYSLGWDIVGSISTALAEQLGLDLGTLQSSFTTHTTAEDPHGDRAYADEALAALVDAAPEALDTLNELAAALNDDANFASTVIDQIADKADADHNHDGTYASSSHNHDGTYVGTSDSRLTDSRTPTAHKTSHESGGSDAISPADIGAATSGHNHDGTYVGTSDSRLTDSRTPTAHKTSHATGGSDAISASDIGAAASDHNHDGTYASSSHNHDSSYVGTSDSRLTDARTPTAHKSSHATGGSDALTASDIGAASSSHTHTSSQITDLAVPTGAACFGDGDDGTVTFDGSTAVAGATLSGSTYTLARDVFYNSATVNSGVTVDPNGYRIFVKGTLTVDGKIVRNGGAASAGTAGTITVGTGNTVPSVTSAMNGKAGDVSTGAAATANTTVAYGGKSGNGGSAGVGGGTSGSWTWGAPNPPPSYLSSLLSLSTFFGPSAPKLSSFYGGQGGSSGAGATGVTSGAGGAGGGVLYVAAKNIAGSGSLEAKGGNGGNAPTNGAYAAGGGGGGGGGVALVITTSSTISTSIDVAGGTGGTGSGVISGTTGYNGSNGSAGRSYIINVLG